MPRVQGGDAEGGAVTAQYISFAGLTLRPGDESQTILVTAGRYGEPPRRVRLDRFIVSTALLRLPRYAPWRSLRRRLIEAIHAGTWQAALRWRGEVVVTQLAVDGHTKLALPSPVPIAMFAPTAVDCAIDWGTTMEGATMHFACRNESRRTVVVYGAWLAHEDEEGR